MDFVHTPDAGDRSVNLTRKQKKDSEIQKGSYEKRSGHKKLNKSLVCRTHPLMNCDSLSIINKGLYNYVALIQNNVIRMENDVTPCHTDYCGFPYYRSCCRANNSFHDCVLLKDAAVSCTLLKSKSDHDNLTLSAIEDYLLKQIKTEYQDISEMTKKISSYTKDKWQNLSKKYKRKPDLINDLKKRPVATEYIDKNGIPCLKLRLEDIDETEFKESIVKNIVSTFINSWNFLSSPQHQQRTDNNRGEAKKIVAKSIREKCSSIYKGISRTDKSNSQWIEKSRRKEIRSDIDRFYEKCRRSKADCCSSHNESTNSDFETNNKIRQPHISIKRDKSTINRGPIKIEKCKSECATAILNSYVANKEMQAINIRIIERHRKNS